MATNTSRLGLRKPAASDPFSRTADFNDNWDKIDAAPGIASGTRAARPASPGVAKAGIYYYATDTKELAEWNGTAWQDVLGNPQSFAGHLGPNDLDPNNQPIDDDAMRTYNFPSFTLTRQSILAGLLTVQFAANQNVLARMGVVFKARQNNVSSTISIANMYWYRWPTFTYAETQAAGDPDQRADWVTMSIPVRSGLLVAGAAITPFIEVTGYTEPSWPMGSTGTIKNKAIVKDAAYALTATL